MNRREHIKSLGLLSAGLVFYQCQPATSKATVAGKNVTLAYRLHPELWKQPFAEIKNGLLQYQSAINEIALFDESLNHRTLLPLEKVQEHADIMQQRIIEFKNAGIASVGINVYDDIGVRNFDGGYTFDYRPMVGHDDKESGWCPCPNDENLHAYFLEKLKIYAATNPDFIWIDDDYRNANKAGIKYSCFCPDCLERFGQAQSREELIAQLNQPENQQLRERWIQFMNDTMDQLALKIKEAIKGVNSNIAIGFMTVGYDLSTYAYDFPTWMQTMEAVKARPGHGYYHEDEPRLIKDKIFDVARQVRDYPDITTDIQYELEDWTYTTLNKSVQTELNESLLGLMAGCNGIAYNAIYANEWEEKTRMLQAIAEQKPLWDKVNALADQMPLVGFWPVDHPNLMSKLNVNSNGWFRENYNIQTPNELAAMGVPFTFQPENSVGALLSGRLVEGFSDAELKNLLSQSVYLDAEALEIIWQRGFGELTGVKHVNDASIAVEIFAEHPLNHGIAGTMRRASGWSRGTYLERLNDQVQAINHLHVMTNQKRKGISLSLFENELGGRVAVSSYHPWDGLGMLAKVTQLTRLMNYLSKDKMPVMLEKSCRIMPLLRQNKAGNRFVLSLFNNSFDTYENVPLSIRNKASQVKILTPEAEENIKMNKKDGQLKINIEKIDPWRVIILTSL